MEKGAVPVFRSRAPLCGKLQYASTNINKPHFLSPSLSLSGLVVILNPGFAQITHVTSAGFVVSNACADMAIARSSSPGSALNPPRVGGEVKVGFHPRRPFARTQVGILILITIHFKS
jgi:hypothetical protein